MTITISVVAIDGGNSDELFPGTTIGGATFQSAGPTSFSGGVNGASLAFGDFIWNARGANTAGTPSTVTASQDGFGGSLEYLELFSLAGGAFQTSVILDSSTPLVISPDSRLFAATVLANADILAGSTGNDTLRGYGGDDSLDGGGGADSLDGGDGFDMLTNATFNTRLTATIDGITVNLGNSALNTPSIGADIYIDIEGLEGTVFGTRTLGGNTFTNSGNDSLTGDAGGNLISGLAGNDTLAGAGGDDTLRGGEGDDSLDGGSGNDTADFSAATAGFTVALLLGGAQSIPGLGSDTLTDIENLITGAFNDRLGGNTANNRLDGGDGADELFGVAGNDTLIGGGGDDTLYGGTGADSQGGGSGDDIYQIDDLGDLAVEAAGEGDDTVFVVVSGWTAGGNLETIYLSGAASSVTGSASGETIVANASLGSTLNGQGGNDALWGQGGADSLSGGAGNDALRAGGGNDSLNGGAGNDALVGGAGADRFIYAATGWGTDELFDFNRAQGDLIDFRGSGVTGIGDLIIYGAGANSVIQLGAARIDVYGIANLTSADFIFT